MPLKRKPLQNHDSPDVALLISNDYDGNDGSKLEELPWTHGDCQELKNLLEERFSYMVYGHYKNVTNNLQKCCSRLALYITELKPGCGTIFLYFSGHGRLDRNERVLKSQDGKTIKLDDLISCFTTTEPKLACKSIILVIDVYRTDNRNLVPTYHHLGFKKIQQNVLVVFATSAIRHEEDSSSRYRWPNCLVDVLKTWPMPVQLTYRDIYTQAHYLMNSRNEPAVILPGSLGVALLISNDYSADSSNPRELPWTHYDIKQLQTVFENKFMYTVHHYSNVGTDCNLLQLCNCIAMLKYPEECRIIFFYFSGCGAIHQGDKQVLYLQGNNAVVLDDLVECFNKPALVKKTKLFFIDACRTEDGDIAPSYHNLLVYNRTCQPNMYTYVVATLASYQAYQEGYLGSCWIKYLVAVLKNSTYQHNICDIITLTQQWMDECNKPLDKISPDAFGVALLLSNDYAIDDGFLEELPYTHYDTRKLRTELEEKCMYTVHRYSNVRADLSQHCNRIAMLEYPEQCRIIFFYFSGHGAILNVDDKLVLYLQEGKTIVLNDLIECFNTPALVHKTKLFFIDACKTEDGDIAPSYHNLVYNRIYQPNTLVVATSAGYQAYQEGYLHSSWPECLVAVLKHSTDQQNIDDILTLTQQHMNECNKPLDKISPGTFGVALLISNDYVTDDNCLEVELPYTHYDTRKLQIVLEEKFMYTVHCYSNVRADLSQHCNRIAMLKYPEQCRIIFFYFSGHGAINVDDNLVLYLQGGKAIVLNDLIECFNTPALVHKTKLFFIDACRTKSEKGNTSYNLVTDPIQNNVLIAFSTSYGCKAYQGDSKGSRWTNCLIEALLHIPIDKSSVLDILKLTKMLMNKRNQSSGVLRQTDEYQHNIADNVQFAKPLEDGRFTTVFDSGINLAKIAKKIKEDLQLNAVTVIHKLQRSSAVEEEFIPIFDDELKNEDTTSLDLLWKKQLWNIFDFDLLDYLVEVSECSTVKQIWETFLSRIDPNLIEDVGLILGFDELEEKCSLETQLRVKLDKKVTEINGALQTVLKEKLCTLFKLKKYSLQCVRIKKGCIEFTYHISKAVAVYLLHFEITRKIMADFISYSIAYLQINNKRLNVPSDITDLDDIFEWSEQSSQEVAVEFTSSSDILQKEPTVDLVAKQPKKHCFDPTDIVEIVVGKDGIAAKKPATIPDFFKETCSKSLHTKAVCWKNSKEVHWQSLTYAKYKELVYAVAKSFLKLGLETYHAVGILGFNSVEWFASSMGAVFAGGLSTGIYTTNSTEVCHYILNSSRANIIVVENQKLLDKILKIRDKLPHLKAIVQYKGELSKDYPDTYTWVKFLELGKDMDDSIIDKIINSQQPNQCAMLVYPDAVGSTDNLKGIMLSHDNITWVTAAYVDAIGEDKLKTHGGEKFISYLPLSHIVPLILDMYLPLYVGGTVYFSQPDALKGSLVITLQDVEPTFFFGVPRVWEKVNETCQNDNWIANAKSTRGIQKQQPYLIVTRQYHAVGLPEPYFWTEKQLFSLKMCKNTIVGVDPTHIIFLDYNTRSMYGVSECTGLQSLETKVSMPKIHMPKIHMPKIPSFVTELSAGKSIRGVEAKLDCQEVFFRGRHVFMGYLGMEKETKETIDEEGWLHSGDTGNVYENGSLSIYDHMADVITMANEEKIYPAKIENLIKSMLPFLSNVVLIGDNQWYLTCLLTLKCFMDPDTGEATDDLQPQVIEMFQDLGSKCTTVSQVLKTEDKKVFNAIQQGIEYVVTVFLKKSKHIIKKWKLLRTDFTMVGEELGPMLNLRRSLVLKKYKKEIETMYSS